ncbi:hypothetical protein LUZ62_071759 [Rhynchospora pubera]|uniref:DEX1 C-terminal domain-containing protein n=1 Tax=Rhynchospora pubera TaxID=906938 RepID=A0AAV8CZZ1_9POAL|nr:hypothetical protein LUZ62_071759 [Rhynchospora pubera]
MKGAAMGIAIVCVVLLLLLLVGGGEGREDGKSNKFRDRSATDDMLPYPHLDEDSLLHSQCPKHLDLRWQTEVSSSIFATPLVADINSDGRLEVVVPSFVHFLEVLEGSDGDKLPGWPAFHHSTVHSSPLLYDIDKDGAREILLPTFNGVVNFFRISGYLMIDKLEVPRRKVLKNWFVGLHPDPMDRSHPHVHDDLLLQEAITSHINHTLHAPLLNASAAIPFDHPANLSVPLPVPLTGAQATNTTTHADAQNTTQTKNVTITLAQNAANSTLPQRRLLEDTKGGKDSQRAADGRDGAQGATVQNNNVLEEDADSSFNLFRDVEDVDDEYSYDYDDYVDESMWGDEDWKEAAHQNLQDYVHVDSHILSTPVIADIDHDGVQEMVVAVSYFFDREYYDKQENRADLGDIDISKYVASGIVVFNLDTKQVKWSVDLDVSTDSGTFRAYMYSSPTVVDLDGDGFLDIIVGTSYGLVYVFDHRGKIRSKFPLEMADIQAQVVAADINDDGKLEIVTCDNHGNVAAWNAQGEEIWEVHVKSSIPQAPTIGDVDGDGCTDVVVPTVSGNVYVLSGKDGSFVRPFPFRTNGRIMSRVLLVDLARRGDKSRGLTLVIPSFDGYLYLVEGSTGCADVVDIGETSYTMALADNVDGGDDLDLIVTTMNGNVFCFSTPSPHHPLKEWRSTNHGKNNMAYRYNREGVYVAPGSRAFRDEEGKHFWVETHIVDSYRMPSGSQAPYNLTTTLLVPGNYQGERKIVHNQVYDSPGKKRVKLPTVPVRTTGMVVVEMVDKNGLYFSDEFSLTFHMHYYKLLKWLVLLPMVGMFGMLVVLRPHEGAPLPSFSRNAD